MSSSTGLCKNSFRSIKGDILVLVGVCTHLGCSPVQKLEVGESSGMGSNWNGGFIVPVTDQNLI